MDNQTHYEQQIEFAFNEEHKAGLTKAYNKFKTYNKTELLAYFSENAIKNEVWENEGIVYTVAWLDSSDFFTTKKADYIKFLRTYSTEALRNYALENENVTIIDNVFM